MEYLLRRNVSFEKNLAVLISSQFDPIVKWKSKITKGIEEYLKCYKEEALEKSKVVKQTKVTTFFTVVQQNAEKAGPSGQKPSKPPLKELDEALELLSDEN